MASETTVQKFNHTIPEKYINIKKPKFLFYFTFSKAIRMGIFAGPILALFLTTLDKTIIKLHFIDNVDDLGVTCLSPTHCCSNKPNR